MITANGGLLAHGYTPQVTQRWPRGSEPASGGVLMVRVPGTVDGFLFVGFSPRHSWQRVPLVFLVVRVVNVVVLLRFFVLLGWLLTMLRVMSMRWA